MIADIRFFDPADEFAVIDRRLPHWTQAGVVCFITWRTHDSIPKEVLLRWRSERHRWLRQHSIDPSDAAWRSQLNQLPKADQHAFYTEFSEKWNGELDAGYGACVLKSPKLSKIVCDSLLKFDGDRYVLCDFVVMPNHVHLLAAFHDADVMLKQCEGWKHYQALMINRAVGSGGRFWQTDSFDHLVRSEEQFEHFRRYIAGNPAKANLSQGEYLLWSRK